MSFTVVRRAPLLAGACIGMACWLVACGGKPAVDGPIPSAAASAAGPSRAASAPPVSVTTVAAQRRDMPVQLNAIGSVVPLSSVDVRPQTTSLVAQVHVKEGQFVTAGQLLFTLDARADEANVARAAAQLARDEAALADAERQLARSRELLAQNFISQGALDTTQANVQSQAAAAAADKAALDAARLGLSYTRIKAPSAGRLGAINVFPGSSVQANLTQMVSITQLDPIAVAFSLPQRYLADALAALKDGGGVVTALPQEGENEGAAPVRAKDPARTRAPGVGTDVPLARTATPAGLQGRLKFVDSAVDPVSGTVKVKAEFANRDNRLWPGAFVDVAMTARVLRGAVVVPQATVVQTARGPQVYVVQDGKATVQPVQVLYAQGEDVAVTGVEAGARIVLDGRQNLRPGAAVVERAGDGYAGRAKPGAGDGVAPKGSPP
ncbi:MAG: efflux RND transporter periplasmic adaptor subunit [Rubrivivax sp.]|nr:efflux RND transporter periplasmic adaptor subunit [Rubrivivax sp.]